MEQLSVFVENKIGSLAKVTTVLKNENISIKAVSVFDSPEFSILRIIVDDSEKAKKLLKSKNFAARTTNVLAIQMEDKTGSLDNLLKVIQDNKLNIQYLYSFVYRGIVEPLLVLKVDDMEKAEKVLKENNIQIVNDL